MKKFYERYLDLVKEANAKMIEVLDEAGLESVVINKSILSRTESNLFGQVHIESVSLKKSAAGESYILLHSKDKKSLNIEANILLQVADAVVSRCRPACTLEVVQERLKDVTSAEVDEHEIDGHQAFSITIEWGDWKHDHGLCRSIMEDLGYLFLDENVTEEDGSDCYSAIHHYVK